MVDTTPIEKKSLEAHVDLCAERYKSMASNIESLDKKVDRLEMMINEVHSLVQKMAQRRTDQLLGWGTGIIAALLGTVGWLVITYVVG
jgi:peptidoglycan hydrolase CwlO-like protein